MDEKLKNKIIESAYKKLSFFEKRSLAKLLKSNEEAAKLYNEHHRAAEKLHSLKSITCPDELVKNVKRKISVEGKKASILQRIYFIAFKNQVVTFAVAVTVLSVVFFVLVSDFNNSKSQYTQAQIELADKQTEQAFAIVSKVFVNSQHTLEANILGEQVGYSIKNSINEINNLFKKGE